MSLQSIIVLLVALASCTSFVAHGQQVASRSGSDDENGMAESEVGAGGQSRQIYSHKHLSPHRMMHFGKRLLVQQAPGIYTTTNQVLDLYRHQPNEQQQQEQEQQPSSSFPYSLYFPMPRDRVLESVQPDSFAVARNRQMMSVVQDLLSRQQQQQQQSAGCDENSSGQQQAQLRRATGPAQPRLMRLMKADESSDSELQAYAANKQSGEAAQQAEGGQLEQHDASGTTNGRPGSDEIDRSSRSIGSGRPLLPGLTRAQFSMLFGAQPSPSSSSQAASLLNFIKKAEPQRMTFMHFGRRR